MIARLVEDMPARTAEDGLTLNILPGAEIVMIRFIDMGAEELEHLQLGRGAWFLQEPPFAAVGIRLDAVILRPMVRVLRVVLAHPERCHAFQQDPHMLEELICVGVLTSITAGSLVGHLGEEARRVPLELACDGMAHNVASDTYDDRTRLPGSRWELFQTGLGPLADWLRKFPQPPSLADRSRPVPPSRSPFPAGSCPEHDQSEPDRCWAFMNRRLMASRVGIDLVSVSSVQETIESKGQRYLDRVYTEVEVRDCQTTDGTAAQRLVARLVAKEATLNVLRPGEQAIPWQTMEVVRHAAGWVYMELAGRAAMLASEAGLDNFALSISRGRGTPPQSSLKSST